MGVKTDFLGVNDYSRAILRSETTAEADNAPRTLHEVAADARTDMGWEVWPDGLRVLLERLAADDPTRPLVVTENGSAWPDAVDPGGRIRDPKRRAFLHDHLEACLRARDAGAPVAGYFAWSLMDNFEWAHGYRMRFGLLRVDPDTQDRNMKDSGRWFARVARDRVLHPAADVDG
jgi:beta-glucosidase